MFSPDGHLLQVEYAMEAVRKGSAVVGVRAVDAVILAVEKRAAELLQVRARAAARRARARRPQHPAPSPPAPPLPQDDRTLQKIVRIDDHISLAFAGLSADARVLVNKARIEAQSYRLTVEDAPSVEFIARYVGGLQQKYTQTGGVRPFGISELIGGVGADGVPQLWTSDPSGVHAAWKANAVGRNSKSLLELLEKNYKDGCSEDEAVHLAVRALLEVVESGAKSIEVGVLRRGQPMQILSEADVLAHVKRLETEKAEEGAGSGAAAATGT